MATNLKYALTLTLEMFGYTASLNVNSETAGLRSQIPTNCSSVVRRNSNCFHFAIPSFQSC